MTPIAHGRPGRPAAATRGDALALAPSASSPANASTCRRSRASSASRGRRCTAGSDPRAAARRGARDARPKSGCWRSARGARQRRRAPCWRPSTASTARSPPRAGCACWLAREQERALRILTSSAGVVQPRMVAAIERLIDAEIEAGAFDAADSPGRPRLRDRAAGRGVPLQRRDRRHPRRHRAPARGRGRAARRQLTDRV